MKQKCTDTGTPRVVQSRDTSLPEEPLSPLQQTIVDLKKTKNAVILAHNYQVDPIQRIADYVGDSLGLCYQAAQTKADIIVFSGVHFMAEAAKIINPNKTVLLPDLDAGCSLSDSCSPEKLARYKAENPGLYVVAYVNCSAAVKAQSDVIVTSGNALHIIEKIPQDREILFVPDQNLGQWVSDQTGRKMRLWPGSCYAHVLFSVRALEKVALHYPNAPIIAHPECLKDVRDRADAVCSTEKMVHFCRQTSAKEIIVLTESGMLNRLRREIPNKTFIAGPTDRCACSDCRFMKMNTLEKIRDCLLHESPRIELPQDILEKARTPIDRMLEWTAN